MGLVLRSPVRTVGHTLVVIAVVVRNGIVGSQFGGRTLIVGEHQIGVVHDTTGKLRIGDFCLFNLLLESHFHTNIVETGLRG